MRLFTTLRLILNLPEGHARRRRYSEKALPVVTIDNDALLLGDLRQSLASVTTK